MPAHPRKRPRVFPSTDIDPQVEYWSPQPVIGFRVWAWSLQSIRGPSLVPWTAATNTAECKRPQVPNADDGSVPPPHLPGQGGACLGNCGIYAYKHADKLIYETVETPWSQRLTRGLPPLGDEVPEGLYGVVKLTGRVIEATEGYRAQHAEVVGLVLPEVLKIWSVTDPEPIAALFADPTEESHHPAWSHRLLERPGGVAIAVLHELERIADGYR